MKKSICKSCTACGACVNKCPRQAVSFELNEKWEEVAVIDERHCMKCGLCTRICPQLNRVKKNKPQKVLAAWTRNTEDYNTTSSGGIATVVSRYVIKRGGVVYGAACMPDGVVKHIRVETEQDIERLKGSKYVQSRFTEVFETIIDDLENKKMVAVIGTPCQIAALRNYIPEKLGDNLYLIDLVCHGTPPSKYYMEYIKYFLKNDKKNVDVTFRKKQYVLNIYQNAKNVYKCKYQKDLYYRAFMYGLICRENCYSCQYSCEERVSDLTICDFWGIDKSKAKIKMPTYVSGILVNTEQGDELISVVSDQCNMEERTIQEIVAGNANLRISSERHKDREIFLRELVDKDFVQAVEATSIKKEIFVERILDVVKIPYRLIRYRKTGLKG